MDEENKSEQTETKKRINKKKIAVVTLVTLIVGFITIHILPFLYFVGTVLYSMFIDIPSKPKVQHGEFPFELVYEYKGEQVTITDTIVCDYDGYSFSLEGGNSRDWTCEFKNNDDYGLYYIDRENEPDLYIIVPDAPDYYMGDKEYTKEDAAPCIVYINEETGTYYEEKEKIDVVDVEIIEWKPSEPLKKNFK
jgi:hypothetical protein